MLKGIDPLLDADLLWALAAAGHGDAVALVDANFPAEALARDSVTGRLCRIGTPDSADALRAILSLMPVDTFVGDAAVTMDPVGAPGSIPPAVAEMRRVLDKAEGRAVAVTPVDRFAFYAATRAAFCVVQTREERPYGCMILRKGVLLSAPA
ncbi:RbsD/FucU family protein [Wenxinia saemankumensis]|uniref:L-fucose mutarotase n=1 Tax=Wenxinia saemankumensis TaxID=1447782 RepID=A0A1M6DTC3_9RHOB|nr:RbsD/FucU domain-containing protein [Wenxinia saemankumensis]SHI76268.1 L-fucose mutarotase [Wenxinia saemankumensis]